MASPLIEVETAGWTTAAGATVTFANAILAGDIVVVACSANQTSSNTLAVSDSQAATYTSVALATATSGCKAQIWQSAAQTAAAAGTFTVRVAPSVAGNGYFVAYLIRASSLSVDTPNVLTGNGAANSIASGATYAMGPFAGTSQAVVIGAVAAYQASATAAIAWATGNALESDNDAFGAAVHHSYLGGHLVTSGAVAGQTFSITAQGSPGASGNAGWALVPFLYTTGGGGTNTAAVSALLTLRVSASVAQAMAANAQARLQAASKASAAQSCTVACVTRLAALARLTVYAGSVNSAAVTMTLGARSSATAHASTAVHAAPILRTLSKSTARTAAAVSAKMTLPAVSSRLTTLALTLGPVADWRWYVLMPRRPFRALIEARPFYAALPARTFRVDGSQVAAQFDTKDPRETVVLTLDASSALAAGETLSTISSSSATVLWGNDPSVSLTLSGAAINATPITVGGASIAAQHSVQVVASAGLDACTYEVQATCTTSNPNKVLTLKGVLPVSAK